MFHWAKGSSRDFRSLLRALGAALISLSAGPALSADLSFESESSANAVTFFAGRAVETDFTDIITQPWTVDFVDISVVAAAISTRLGTLNELGSDLGNIGDHLSLELEAGAAYRFGDEDQGEFWGAIFLRYDDFPWNDAIYTTIAANTGLSILTETSEFEKDRSDGQSSLLLHYLAPEITFANPDYKDLELLLKLHHRSGVFGLFDGVHGGSTFVSGGIRFRF
jgi:hypothetical protein